MLSKNIEEFVYQAVVDGELVIEPNGEIWRVACRRWILHGVGTRTIPCEPRRAEKGDSRGKYLFVSVMYDKVRYQALAHRLVYRHFNGSIPIGLTVNHKDGCKKNNDPENLELATQSEQMIHAVRILKTANAANQSGEHSSTAKLKWNDIKAIRECRLTGQTLEAIATRYGVCIQTISNIVNNKSWILGMEAVK